MFRLPKSLGFHYLVNHLTESFKAHKRNKCIIMSKIIYTSLDVSVKIFLKSAMGRSYSFRFYTQNSQKFNMLVLKGKRSPSRVILKLKDKDG